MLGTQSDLLGEADPGTLSRNPCGPARFAANVSSTSPRAQEPPQTTRGPADPLLATPPEEGSAGGDSDSGPPPGASVKSER